MKNKLLGSLAIAIQLCLAPAALASMGEGVKLNNDVLKYHVWHKMIMPNQDLALTLPMGFTASVDGVPVSNIWTAPDTSGHHMLSIFDGDKQTASVTLFVLEPSANVNQKGYLGEYRIGKYPKDTPPGFIRVDKDNVGLKISPSFKLGQFLCKQQATVWPKYVLVSEGNLTRLETLLKDLNENNITNAKTLFVMSGYRTPFYNAAIGSAKFSRHMYGDAADVYIDSDPRDGVMDDVNGDNKITKADANFLYDYAKDLYVKQGSVKGGLGSYKANAVHGPFVHIDARGRPARWGR